MMIEKYFLLLVIDVDLPNLFAKNEILTIMNPPILILLVDRGSATLGRSGYHLIAH